MPLAGASAPSRPCARRTRTTDTASVEPLGHGHVAYINKYIHLIGSQ